MTSAPSIYQLHASLLDIEPPIWRQLQVPADMTLENVHYALQDAFGWTNSHLHEFRVVDQRYGMKDVDHFDSEEELMDERTFRLHEVAKERSRFLYEYDFGDGWEHLLVVEKVEPAATRVRRPVCLAGARACPPDDCGGPHGYADLLDALANPRSRRAKELRQWLSGPFDPERFDLEAANAALRAGRTRRLTERAERGG